ncbi:MAG: hypothetical protein ACRDTC_19605 [Pseudonocardiaceae bacterium]
MMVELPPISLSVFSVAISTVMIGLRYLFRRSAAREIQVRYTDVNGKKNLLRAGGSEEAVADVTVTVRSIEGIRDRQEIANVMDSLVNRHRGPKALESHRPYNSLPGPEKL